MNDPAQGSHVRSALGAARNGDVDDRVIEMLEAPKRYITTGPEQKKRKADASSRLICVTGDVQVR